MRISVRAFRYSVLLIFFIPFAIWIVTSAIDGNKELDAAQQNGLPSTKVITREDSALISQKYIKMIKVQDVANSRVKNTVSFLYTIDRNFLVVYKIDLSTDAALTKVLKTKLESTDRSNDVVYRIEDFNGFSRFRWNAAYTPPTSGIYFSLGGDSIQKVAENDTIVSYHLRCKNFSVKYGENAPAEIHLQANRKALWFGGNVSLDLLFLKRGRVVYLMLLAPSRPNLTIPPSLLHDMVMGN